jgi:hypothetical protein
MRKILVAAFSAVLLTGGVVASATAASAHTHTPHHQVVCNSDWYQNPDETTRKPVQKPSGLEFSDTDLVHHKVYGLTVEHLHPGAYVAYPAPGQPSFFSVEVSGSDGKYGTLRWNRAAGYWEATSQGQQHHDTNPAALADAFPLHLSHTVVSFGVGFTANPPGTVTTLVRWVKFNRHLYWLGCKPVTHRPPHHPKPPYTHSPTPTPTPTQTVPVTPPGSDAPPATPIKTQPNFTG